MTSSQEIKALSIKVIDIDIKNGTVTITDGKCTRVVKRKLVESLIKAGRFSVQTSKCRCVSKIRDKAGRIINYSLVDSSGRTYKIEANTLKSYMYAFKIECINLTLTSDYRLVDHSEQVNQKSTSTDRQIPEQNAVKADKNEQKQVYILSNDSIEAIFSFIKRQLNQVGGYFDKVSGNRKGRKIDVRIFGNSDQIQNRVYDLAKGIKDTQLLYICKQDQGRFTFAVFPKRDVQVAFPSNQNTLFLNSKTLNLYRLIDPADSSNKIFTTCTRIQQLVLDGIGWGNVESADGMFMITQIERLIIKNQVASKLKQIRYFANLQALEYVDMQGIRMPSVESADGMFKDCIALDIRNVNISSIRFKNNQKISNEDKKLMFGTPFIVNHFYNFSDCIDLSNQQYFMLPKHKISQDAKFGMLLSKLLKFRGSSNFIKYIKFNANAVLKYGEINGLFDTIQQTKMQFGAGVNLGDCDNQTSGVDIRGTDEIDSADILDQNSNIAFDTECGYGLNYRINLRQHRLKSRDAGFQYKDLYIVNKLLAD